MFSEHDLPEYLKVGIGIIQPKKMVLAGELANGLMELV